MAVSNEPIKPRAVKQRCSVMKGGVTNSNYAILERCILNNDSRMNCALFVAFDLMKLPSQIANLYALFLVPIPNAVS